VAFGEQYIIALDSDLPLTKGSRQQLWLATNSIIARRDAVRLFLAAPSAGCRFD